MNWLEIIELRLVNSSQKDLEFKIKLIMDEFQRAEANHIIKIYSSLGLDSDLSIHILHSSTRADISGSPVGMQIIYALKEFGLTNHSIWIERS